MILLVLLVGGSGGLVVKEVDFGPGRLQVKLPLRCQVTTEVL